MNHSCPIWTRPCRLKIFLQFSSLSFSEDVDKPYVASCTIEPSPLPRVSGSGRWSCVCICRCSVASVGPRYQLIIMSDMLCWWKGEEARNDQSCGQGSDGSWAGARQQRYVTAPTTTPAIRNLSYTASYRTSVKFGDSFKR
jgi:hypothetical protein